MNDKQLNEQVEKAKKYYAQFDKDEPTVHDWRKWLDSLPKNMHDDFYDKGFDYSLKALPFQAWYLSTFKGLEL